MCAFRVRRRCGGGRRDGGESGGDSLPRGRQTFDAVHAYGARAIATAAAEAGARLVHVSAIGADAESAVGYARSKGQGEAAARAAVPGAVVLRPSIVFGPRTSSSTASPPWRDFSPFLPLIGGGGTRFQPVFVADVAAAVQRAVEGLAKPGAVYELGGPEVRTFKD